MNLRNAAVVSFGVQGTGSKAPVQRLRSKGYRLAGLLRYARYTSVLSSCKNSVFQC